jgi:hypothetical protein
MTSKEEQLQAIANTNHERCNFPQLLDAVEITVSTMPNINLYIFELVQNSIDCGASEVSFLLEDNAGMFMMCYFHCQVSFQHNGDPFGETDKHVKGMSNIFQSTKTLGSIGFMGFGFKTVYKRFTRVDISDNCGWKFFFDVGFANLRGLAPDFQRERN